MEFVGQEKPDNVEIHVKMSRSELEKILADIENGEAFLDPYSVTWDFMSYLRRL